MVVIVVDIVVMVVVMWLKLRDHEKTSQKDLPWFW